MPKTQKVSKSKRCNTGVGGFACTGWGQFSPACQMAPPAVLLKPS